MRSPIPGSTWMLVPIACLALLLGAGCSSPVEKLWEFPTSSALYSTPLVVSDLIVFGSEGGTLHAVDIKGHSRWQHQVTSAEIISHPQTDGKLIFFGATNQTFYAIDVKGQVKWQFNTKERIKSDPAVVDGVVYVTSYDGHVYALAAENGRKQWQFPPPESTEKPEPPAPILSVAKTGAFINDKAVDLKDLGAKLTEAAKARKDKSLSLNFEPGLPAKETLRITDLAKKAGFANVALLPLKEGEEFKAPRVPEAPPPPPPDVTAVKPAEFSYAAPVIRDGVLYVGNLDGFMYALNTADGSLKWRFQAGEGITSTAWVEGGLVYFGSKDDHVYAIDSATGSQVKWKFKTGADVLSSPKIADGTLSIGSDDTNFYLLDAATGKEKCRFKTNGQVISYGVFHQNAVFFAGAQGDNTIYAINKADCQKIWSYRTGYKIESDPVIEGDRLYVTSGDMKLHAFKINQLPE